MCETHVGLVVLVGDRAYKVKKAIRTPFLDFTTPRRRLIALQRELDLNRRLAPDVYLGLVHISPLSPTGTSLDGAPGDHALVMRRMPAERSLAALVRAGAGRGRPARPRPYHRGVPLPRRTRPPHRRRG